MESNVAGIGRFKTAFAFAVAAAVIVALYWLRSVLLLSFIAVLIALLLDGLASAGVRYLRMRRGAAVIVAAVLFLVAVAGALTLVIVPLAREGTQLVQSLPETMGKLQSRIDKLRKEFPWVDRFLPSNASQGQEQALPKAPQVAKKALLTASAAMEGGATALALFFLGLFLAWDPERWISGITRLWPHGSPEERANLLRKIGTALRSYLVTLGLYIVLMGGAWALGLWLIGIRYPLLFGAIGGLVEIVPYVGPLLGLIPPLLLALSAGSGKVIAVVVLYAVLHVIEGYLLVPLLMQRGTHLPPPMVVFSILVFGTLFGTLGVVLAVPLATVIYVWVNERVYPARTVESPLLNATARAA